MVDSLLSPYIVDYTEHYFIVIKNVLWKKQEAIMEKQLVERTQSFRWNSKLELYSYFNEKYGMNKTIVDGAIAESIRAFHIRKHQVIKTQELWQKVGNVLEGDYLSLMTANNIN